MKKLVLLLCGAIVLSVCASPILALPEFKKEFDKKYVESSGDAALEAAFKTASCNTCHVKGESKSVNNPYGVEIAKLIEGSAKERKAAAKEQGDDAYNAEKEKIIKELHEAFKKIEANEELPFGARLKNNQLPVE